MLLAEQEVGTWTLGEMETFWVACNYFIEQYSLWGKFFKLPEKTTFTSTLRCEYFISCCNDKKIIITVLLQRRFMFDPTRVGRVINQVNE